MYEASLYIEILSTIQYPFKIPFPLKFLISFLPTTNFIIFILSLFIPKTLSIFPIIICKMFHSEKELERELWEFWGNPPFHGSRKKSGKGTEKEQPKSPGKNNKRKCNESAVGIKKKDNDWKTHQIYMGCSGTMCVCQVNKSFCGFKRCF